MKTAVKVLHISCNEPKKITKGEIPHINDNYRFHIDTRVDKDKSIYVDVMVQSIVKTFSNDESLIIGCKTNFQVWSDNESILNAPLINEGIDLLAELLVSAAAHCRKYQAEVSDNSILHNIGYMDFISMGEARVKVLRLYEERHN